MGNGRLLIGAILEIWRCSRWLSRCHWLYGSGRSSIVLVAEVPIGLRDPGRCAIIDATLGSSQFRPTEVGVKGPGLLDSASDSPSPNFGKQPYKLRHFSLGNLFWA